MLLLNFSHPLTDEQRAEIETLTRQVIAEIRTIPAQFDNTQPFDAQICELIDGLRLSSKVWQTRPILVNPPAYNFAALTLLAELHGRCGYFPTHLRMRPVPGSNPPRFEVAELVNLQAVRDAARQQRTRDRRPETDDRRLTTDD